MRGRVEGWRGKTILGSDIFLLVLLDYDGICIDVIKMKEIYYHLILLIIYSKSFPTHSLRY